MATKAVYISDVPNLDQVPETAASFSLYATRLPIGMIFFLEKKFQTFVVTL